ncbi:MAG: glycosyltransferase [Treponema sp.]|nr:glycosyltransferase [Treponema sp.]
MNETISVLMCVYNGERYLIEQLESIRNQTYQPNEVIIYDDCSSDSSVKIIRTYIIKYNLELTWKLIINQSRKGWKKNFFDAIIECNSDYIFFCDQDDIWNLDKLSIMIDTMKKNKDILVLNGLVETIDANGNPVNYFNHTKTFYDKKTIKLNLYDTVYNWRGKIACAMAIHKTIKEQLKYFECNEWFAHDIWSNNIGALLNGCYKINYPVIKYRIHENNATAKTTIKMITRKKERIQRLEEKSNGFNNLYNGVKKINSDIIDKYEYKCFLHSIAYNNFILNSMKNFNLLNIFYLVKYIKIYLFYLKYKYFLLDILEILNLRDIVIKIKYSLYK